MRRLNFQQRWYAAALSLSCAAIAALVLLATGALGGANRSYDYIPPIVPPGVTLHQSYRALEKNVLDALGSSSILNSVRVVSTRADLPEAVPEMAGTVAGSDAAGGPAWIIRANGLFRPVTDPPGAHPLTTPRDGYVVIDDTTGNTLAYGW